MNQAATLESLTERQRQIYDWVRTYIRQNSNAPTLREIARAFGIASINGIVSHVRAMEKKGVMCHDHRLSRGIRLLVPEPIRAQEIQDGIIALDCGDRVYHLDKPGAAQLGQSLLKLAIDQDHSFADG